jgi:hypothetical protein
MSRAGERLQFQGYEARCSETGERYRLDGDRVELIEVS